MANTYTITFDANDFTGGATLIRTAARVITNLEPGAVLADTDGKKLYVGDGPVKVNPDGTGEMELLESSSSDYNFTGSIQYWLVLPVVDPSINDTVERRIGPFTVTGDSDLADHAHEFETPATSVTWRDGFVTQVSEIAGTAGESARLAAAMAGAQSGIHNPGALANYRSVIAAGVTAPKIVLTASSSTIEGAVASSWANTIPMLLQQGLRDVTSTTGALGYVPAVATTGAFTAAPPGTRNGTAVMGQHGPGGRALHISASGHHWEHTAHCSRVRVHYGKAAFGGGSTMKVLIDDVEKATLSSIGTVNSSGHVWDSGPLPAGNHKVRVTPPASGFAGIVEAVEFLYDTPAPVVINAAHYGYKLSDWLTTGMELAWQHAASLAADLYVLMPGANDVIAEVPAATYLAQLDQVISKIPAGKPVLIIGQYLRGDATSDPDKVALWAEYQAGHRARATGRVAYVDLAPHWPALVADGSTSDGLMYDTPPVHPNDAGMAKIATVLTAGLGPGSDLTFVLKGEKGDRGLPGVNAVPAKEAVDAYNADLIDDEDSETRGRLNAAIGEQAVPVAQAAAADYLATEPGVADAAALAVNTALAAGGVATLGATQAVTQADRFPLVASFRATNDTTLVSKGTDTGQAWTPIAGILWRVIDNTAALLSSTSSGLIVTDPGVATGNMVVPLTFNTGTPGLAVRYVNASNHLLVRFASNTVELRKRTEGTLSAILASAPLTLVAGTTYRVVIGYEGDQIHVSVDDVWRFSYKMTSGEATQFAAATPVGLYSHSSATPHNRFGYVTVQRGPLPALTKPSEAVATIAPEPIEQPLGLPVMRNLIDGSESNTITNGSLSLVAGYNPNTRGYRIRVNSGTTSETNLYPTASIVTGQCSVIGAMLYVPDPALMENLTVALWHPGPNVWQKTATSISHAWTQGWNMIRWHASAGITAGVLEQWGKGLDRIQIKVDTTAGMDVILGALWAECPDAAPMVLINDGCYKKFLDSGFIPDCIPRKIPLTWASIPMWIENADARAVTLAELEQYGEAVGSVVSIHSYDGASYGSATPEEIRTDNLLALRWLRAHGFTRLRWRAAFTQGNAPEYRAVTDLYMLLRQPITGSTTGLNVWPPIDPFGIRRHTIHGRSSADIDAIFATLKATGDMFMPFTHGIDAAGGNDATPAEWAYFLSKVDVGISEGWLRPTTVERLITDSGIPVRDGGGDWLPEIFNAGGRAWARSIGPHA